MIEFRHVTIHYPGAPAPVLADVHLTVPEGEFCLVVGATGAGKSTLLGAACGRVPHFTGGHLAGEVLVEGRSTAEYPPRELCDVVGMVPQNPAASFVTDTVEEELAYVMENLGVPAADMARRIEDTLDLLDLAAIRHRAPRTLSGGQQQRVAIAAVLAASPRVLVLDEPTSALDPAAADDVLAALARLVHDLGLTLLLAEHRLERVAHLADRVLVVDGDGTVRSGTPSDLLGDRAPAPPVTRLGRRLGWDPPPVSVREARRHTADLRNRLTGRPEPDRRRPAAAPVASVADLRLRYGGHTALDGVDLTIHRGEVLGVMGRNGAGKSSLLHALAGLPPEDGGRRTGRVEVDGADPVRLGARDLIRRVGLVPQDHDLVLLENTVAGECAGADADAGLPPGTTAEVLERLIPGLDPATHPRDLSEGSRLGLALAVILAPAPPVVLLDEPTRGLDYDAKERLVGILDGLAREGHAVVVATHDVELVAELADRVVVLADGRIVDDGATRHVVCRSPVFSPQVSRILAPAPWLTVDEVLAAVVAP